MNIICRISEHRAFLMALAIIIIVIYHFKCWVNGFPWYIGVVLQFGYIGVDLFFFLSGLGLGFSYEKIIYGVFTKIEQEEFFQVIFFMEIFWLFLWYRGVKLYLQSKYYISLVC